MNINIQIFPNIKVIVYTIMNILVVVLYQDYFGKLYDNYVMILNVISVKEYAKTIQFIPK